MSSGTRRGDGKPGFPPGSRQIRQPGLSLLSDPLIQLVGTRPIGRSLMRTCPVSWRGPSSSHGVSSVPRTYCPRSHRPRNPRGLAPSAGSVCSRFGEQPNDCRRVHGPGATGKPVGGQRLSPAARQAEESPTLCLTMPGPSTNPRALVNRVSPEPPCGPRALLSF